MSRTNDATHAMRWAIESVIAEVVDECGCVPASRTADLACSIMEGLRESIGGGDLYLPRIDRSRRDAAIRAEFTGCNHALICERYGVSRSTLYRILGVRDGG